MGVARSTIALVDRYRVGIAIAERVRLGQRRRICKDHLAYLGIVVACNRDGPGWVRCQCRDRGHRHAIERECPIVDLGSQQQCLVSPACCNVELTVGLYQVLQSCQHTVPTI